LEADGNRERDRVPGGLPQRRVAAAGLVIILACTLYYLWGRKAGLPDRISAGSDGTHFAAVYQCVAALVIMLVPSVLAARFLLGAGFRDLGLATLGDWRWGLKATVPVCAAAALFLLLLPISSADPLCAYYPLDPKVRSGVAAWLAWEPWYLAYYLGWEGTFRGVVQLGLGRKMGFVPAMLLQAALTTLLHAGNPPSEVLGALAAAPLFGYAAWRTGSVWYGLAVHFVVGAGVDAACSVGQWP